MMLRRSPKLVWLILAGCAWMVGEGDPVGAQGASSGDKTMPVTSHSPLDSHRLPVENSIAASGVSLNEETKTQETGSLAPRAGWTAGAQEKGVEGIVDGDAGHEESGSLGAWPPTWFSLAFEASLPQRALKDVLQTGYGGCINFYHFFNNKDLIRIGLDLGFGFGFQKADRSIVEDDDTGCMKLLGGIRLAPTLGHRVRPFVRGGFIYRVDIFDDPELKESAYFPYAQTTDNDDAVGYYAGLGLEVRLSRGVGLVAEIQYDGLRKLFVRESPVVVAAVGVCLGFGGK